MSLARKAIPMALIWTAAVIWSCSPPFHATLNEEGPRREILRSNSQAVRLQQEGDFDAAESLYQSALRLARMIDSLDLQALLLHNLGSLHQSRGRSKEALKSYREAHRLRTLLKDTRWMMIENVHIAGVLLQLGRLEEAQQRLLNAERWARGEGDLRLLSMALAGLSRFHRSKGELRTSESLLMGALKLDRKAADRSLEAAHLVQLGTLRMEQGRFSEAQRDLEEALVMDKARNYVFGVAMDLYHLAILHFRTGRKSKGIILAQRAMPILEQLGLDKPREDLISLMRGDSATFPPQGLSSEASPSPP